MTKYHKTFDSWVTDLLHEEYIFARSRVTGMKMIPPKKALLSIFCCCSDEMFMHFLVSDG